MTCGGGGSGSWEQYLNCTVNSTVRVLFNCKEHGNTRLKQDYIPVGCIPSALGYLCLKSVSVVKMSLFNSPGEGRLGWHHTLPPSPLDRQTPVKTLPSHNKTRNITTSLSKTVRGDKINVSVKISFCSQNVAI